MPFETAQLKVEDHFLCVSSVIYDVKTGLKLDVNFSYVSFYVFRLGPFS